MPSSIFPTSFVFLKKLSINRVKAVMFYVLPII